MDKEQVNHSFPWDGSELVLNEYKKDNIKIENTGHKTSKAIIFFSSNALYYPNDEESFKKSVIEKSRYEFENISKDPMIQNEFELIIYVRDIYKQWCVNGINERINTIEKLRDYLKEITNGYEITTCGCSSGGYLATLLGNMLGADKIFNLSGQFYLWDELSVAPYLFDNKDNEEKSKYYDITKYIKSCYFIYPARAKSDIFQCSFVKDNNSVKRLPINSDSHGSTVSPDCYKYLFRMTKEELDSLFEKFKDREMVSRREIDALLLPLFTRIKRFPKNFLKKIAKLLKSK